MRKCAKFIVAVLVAVSIFLLYTYVLFDHQPFDDLRAGEIASARFILDGGHISISNLGTLPDILEDIELERRVYNTNKNIQKGRVTVELTFYGGKTSAFTVNNKYITTEEGIFTADAEENAIFLKWAFGQIFFDTETIENGNQGKIDEIIDMATEGKDWAEIRDWAESALISGGLSDSMLNSLTNQGYSPIYIYVLGDKNRNQLITQTMELKCDTQNRLLVEKIWSQYKNSTSGYPDKQPPDDFDYGDAPDWYGIELGHNEYYTYATIPSSDKKYDMLIYFDEAEFTLALNEVTYKRPRFRFVSFNFGEAADIPADYPPVNVIKSGNALATADILTEKLTICLNSSPETPYFSKVMFICMLNYIENKNFCYYNIFPLMPDRSNSQFKTTNMEKVIRQVLGDYQWDAENDFGSPPNGGFNKQRQSFEFSTDFGWGVMSWSARNISSSFSADGKQVYSVFDLRGPDSAITTDPGYKEYGKYRAIYDIVTEDGEIFLRFNKYEKI